MPNVAYLSLGSNIEPEANLPAAVRLLTQLTTLAAISSVWETAPLGVTSQANFLNAAAVVETDLTASALKEEVLEAIERQLGRVRQADKNAPRPIDLDIMLFNEDILEVGQRHIPDPEIIERAFVAIPLAEIAPHYRHPELGQTLAKIASRFETSGMRLRPEVSRVLAELVSYHEWHK
ncbi:MAG: 2-amino-4-hydroxy-6-hydroxymethyldihydropteridine diphosphokinase [Anaerolineae bacterium]